MRFIIVGLMLVMSLNMFAGGMREGLVKAKVVAVVAASAAVVGGGVYVGNLWLKRRRALAPQTAISESDETAISESDEDDVSVDSDGPTKENPSLNWDTEPKERVDSAEI